ncbi:MAG: MucR family transcriptional regulator [Alphaproteobacteria bacterium HGW-Alphaproteobacteria-12]|nr:MAG: MucR family transcriptional regulator [Alphaproteobacteria bacterium HGW-Alphaproteobacteria-12]
MAVEIVSAYVGHNKISSDELSGLIHTVFGALTNAALGEVAGPAPNADPAVPVRRSVTPDYLICLEDGKRFKSLKRHLRTQYDLSPEEYRTKWGLPRDYPMVAPNYAQARSRLAKKMGLGQSRNRKSSR